MAKPTGFLHRLGLEGVHRRALAGVAGVGIATNLLMLAVPLFSLQVYDRVLSSRSSDTLWLLALGVLIALVALAALETLRSWLLIRVANRYALEIEPKVLDAGLTQSALRGVQPTQLLRDANTVRNFIGTGHGLVALMDAPMAPVFIFIVAMLHPWLGFATLMGALLLLGLTLATEALTAPQVRDAGEAAMREAYLSGAAVVTPNPRAHALYADKRALGLLCDESWLRAVGLDAGDAALLAQSVPHTAPVLAEEGPHLWQDRKRLFFKPVAGFGSRGAYRGEKLTRRVFDEILQGGYVAQALVPPPQRAATTQDGVPLKYDVRNYAYAGRVQLLAARLWRGQTTNFRTEGGGFAPVFVLPPDRRY